jgi:hypothetical protein
MVGDEGVDVATRGAGGLEQEPQRLVATELAPRRRRASRASPSVIDPSSRISRNGRALASTANVERSKSLSPRARWMRGITRCRGYGTKGAALASRRGVYS